ncbi:hypothetical protein TrVE_jg9475 [Triparma verrucosa]|uniref:Uncharacterized protein n=1 Tax=Triparma verrucosa TaxID=1606542 RepID=A0A9W7F679_9STRA|nr:hypothetical protein TrVE_jg9475 [Triparma verrucosa]
MNNTSRKKARAKPKLHGTKQQKETDEFGGNVSGQAMPRQRASPIPGLEKSSIPDLLDAEYSKMKYTQNSDLMFGHFSSYLPLVDMEDESFTSWYRKTAGMHTVETWLSNYKRHPYAWGALIMIHGVDEVSARLRSKVENYAVYSAVLLSASVVLFAFTEINQHFDTAHWILKRIYLYALCVSVSSHMCSILLSMHFVNALNEAGRDADVIRMFGEGQGFLATHKCAQAFQMGLYALAVGVIDMIAINFEWFDGLACTIVGGIILFKLKGTSEKLFNSSSLVAYWRWGVGKDGEVGSRAVENEDPFDLLIPMERVTMKVGISNRLCKLIKGEEVIGEDDKRRLDLEHKESEMRKSYLEKRQNLLSPANKHNGGKKKSMFAEEGSEGGEVGDPPPLSLNSLEGGMRFDEGMNATLLHHEDGFSNTQLGSFGSPL